MKGSPRDSAAILLGWLEDAACYADGAGWCCRRSTTGRGMRLHEISREEAAELGVRVFPTPREALLNAMRGTA